MICEHCGVEDDDYEDKHQLPEWFDRIDAFACKDPDRPNLRCMSYSDGWMISTDGHRMYGMRMPNGPGAGQYSLAEYRASQSMVALSGLKFPEWKSVLPKPESLTWRASIELPKWVSLLTAESGQVTASVTPRGLIYGYATKAKISLNLALLAPLHWGYSLEVAGADPAKPMVAAPSNPLDPLAKENDWFALIMPLTARGDERIGGLLREFSEVKHADS